MEDFVDILTFAGIVGTIIILALHIGYRQYWAARKHALDTIDIHIMALEDGWTFLDEDDSFATMLVDEQLDLKADQFVDMVCFKEIALQKTWLFRTTVVTIFETPSRSERNITNLTSVMVELREQKFPHLVILSERYLEKAHPKKGLGKATKFHGLSNTLNNASCFSSEIDPIYQTGFIEKLDALIDHPNFAALIVKNRYLVLHLFGRLANDENSFAEASRLPFQIISTFSKFSANNDLDSEIRRLKQAEK